MFGIAPEIIFLSGIALAVVVGVVIGLSIRSRNRKAFAEFASTHDLEFEPYLSKELSEEIKPGRYNKLMPAVNSFSGKVGWTTVRIASLRYSTHRNGSTNTVITTVGAIPYSGPSFEIKPVDPKIIAQYDAGREKLELAASKIPMLGRMMDRFGNPDPVEVDDHTGEFTDGWMVTGDDPDAIRTAVNKPLQEFAQEHRFWTIESNGSWLILYRHSRRLPRGEYESFLEALKDLDRAREAGAGR